jgi:transposase
VEKLSRRAIAKRLDISRHTVEKYHLGKNLPDMRKTVERASPLREATEATILNFLEQNKSLPKKQRFNAHHIWLHLLEKEGIAVAESTVREHVRALRNQHPEAFIPLAHDPGEAMQVDWGDAAVYIKGVRHSVSMFCAALPHSAAIFCFVYPDKTMISFLEGHIQTFEMLGGVPQSCIYDNLKTAAQSGSGKSVIKNKQFRRMEAHYAFQSVFCNPESGNEKGSVENAVSIARKIAFTPMPRVADFAELQAHVTSKCLAYINEHKIKAHPLPMQQEFEADRAALLPLPGMPLDNGFTVIALVHPDQTVRCESIRYSVPHQLVGSTVTLRLSPFHVAIHHKGKEVYRHNRAMAKEGNQYVLDHYLEVLERKPRAVEQAIPIRSGIMPKECRDFLQLCPEKNARQQLVDALLLGREYERDTVLWAFQQANNTRRPTFTLVKAHLEMTRGAVSLEGPSIREANLKQYDSLLGKEVPTDDDVNDGNPE